MAFGQQPGPPATARQVQQLTALVQAAGHTDFRDARGPLGLNQRQAAGRFTRDEADALIIRLETEAEAGAASDRPARAGHPAERAHSLHAVPTERLAAELQRRGWIVVEP
ncbi:hypothetical protein BH20ACT2_BH20ACT2_11360 [soil metagenome]